MHQPTPEDRARTDGEALDDGRLWCRTCWQWREPAVWLRHHGRAPDGGPIQGRTFALGVLDEPDPPRPTSSLGGF